MRFRNLALLGVTAALALTACTSSGEPQSTLTNQTSTHPSQSTAVAFPLPTAEWNQEVDMDPANLNATLYRDGQCLLSGYGPDPASEDLYDGVVIAVVWPQGFTASESDKGVVSVRSADGTVVALSGQGINVGGIFSPGEGVVASEITSWLGPECAGKYDEVFVVQGSVTSSDPDPLAPDPLADLVTKPGQLEGKWFAAELYGKDVKPREDETIPVPYLVFSSDQRQRLLPLTWNTDDGCNVTGGKYTVTKDGTFNANDAGSTFVACPQVPVWSMHGANIQAVTEADQAFVQLPITNGTAVLTLTAKGQVIGVYETNFIEG